MLPSIFTPALAFLSNFAFPPQTILDAATTSVSGVATSQALWNKTCHLIERTLSDKSGVSYPGNVRYSSGIYHASPVSMQDSVCVAEPGSVEDVSRLMKILNKHERTPFAIKSGGHQSNAGYSSSPGVLIWMTRFNRTVYHPENNTADLEPGQIWDNAYSVLTSQGVNVAGGRIHGVGVGGFILGGGYSYLSNSVGLAIDTVTAFDLVLPNGTFVHVTEETQPELFFGLTGGGNNFGVVTKFTMKTFPQGKVWGGHVMFSNPASIALGNAAVERFQQKNTDVMASLLATYVQARGALRLDLALFYNGTTPAPGVFDDILEIPQDPNAPDDFGTKTYVELVLSVSGLYANDKRVRQQTANVMFTAHTVPLLNDLTGMMKYYESGPGSFVQGAYVVVAIEPFQIGAGVVAKRNNTGYPHHEYGQPSIIVASYTDPANDETAIKAVTQMTTDSMNIAKRHGQDLGPVQLYNNYCLFNQPVKDMFKENFHRLKKLRAKYDPAGIMLRTGGWKFI